MTEESEKLSRFSKAVYGVAEKQVEEIISQAKASHDEEIERASRQGREQMEDKIKTGSAEITGRYVRLAAEEELESKRRLLRHREALADKVFDNIAARLEEFRNSSEYPEYLLKLISEIKEENGIDQGVIYISPKDENHIESLLAKAGNGFTTEIKKSIKMGGLSVLCKKNGTLFDKTIDWAFEEQKELFRRTAPLKI